MAGSYDQSYDPAGEEAAALELRRAPQPPPGQTSTGLTPLPADVHRHLRRRWRDQDGARRATDDFRPDAPQENPVDEPELAPAQRDQLAMLALRELQQRVRRLRALEVAQESLVTSHPAAPTGYPAVTHRPRLRRTGVRW